MRILQLSKYYPPYLGGLELVAQFFSRAAVDLGYHVDVVSLGNENKSYRGDFGEDVHQCKELIKIRSCPLSLRYFNQVVKLLERKPSYIFVHLPNPMAHEILRIFSKKLKRSGTKIIGIYHSDIINQVFLKRVYNMHFKRDSELYYKFVCSSPNLKNLSDILSDLPSEKVEVIPYCVDHLFGARNLNRALEFKGKFIAIGRMVPYKGFEFLIETFKTLPFQLTIVGDGPLLDTLKSKASSNIRFVGKLSEDEKFELMKQHDALIMSSINRAEAYGMTLVESFSIGLPVIAANIDTGVSFLVRDQETGLKFAIQDLDSLRDKIQLFSIDKDLRLQLAMSALDFYRNELNYESFYHNVGKLLGESEKVRSILPNLKKDHDSFSLPA